MRGVLSHIIIFTRYSFSLPLMKSLLVVHHLHTVNCSSFACGAENGRKDESESCPRPSAAVATVSPFPVFFTRFVKFVTLHHQIITPFIHILCDC